MFCSRRVTKLQELSRLEGAVMFDIMQHSARHRFIIHNLIGVHWSRYKVQHGGISRALQRHLPRREEDDQNITAPFGGV